MLDQEWIGAVAAALSGATGAAEISGAPAAPALLAGAVAVLLIGAAIGAAGARLVGRRRRRGPRPTELEARLDALRADRDALRADRDAARAEAAGARLRAEGVEERLDRYVRRLSDAVSGDALARPFVRWVAPPWTRAESRIPIIAVANLKGGVGKTTLAANLGAYLGDADARSPGLGGRVLFIDLDFQGSLSQTLAASAGGRNEGRSAEIFEAGREPRLLLRAAGRPDARRLPGSAFFDCDLASARDEERLLFDWAVAEAPDRELRLALAEFLYDPAVQDDFDAVVLDLPPRRTLFAAAGLIAATDLVVPARADGLSVDTVGRFLAEIDRRRAHLWPELRLTGLVATMTERADLSEREAAAVQAALEAGGVAWTRPGDRFALLGSVPASRAIAAAAGQRFAFFDAASEAPRPPQRVFADVGAAVAARLSRGALADRARGRGGPEAAE